MSQTIEERRDGWCQPISAESFGGEPSRYDEKYEQLLGEIGKLDSVTGEVCNWARVYEAADVLLRTRSKDMTLLGALCVALLKREGFAGLAAGLAAYQWLIENRSDDLFPRPQRQRGRAGAYTWLTERLARELETTEARASDLPALEAAHAAFEGLDGLLRRQLGELHPRVGPVTRRLRELLESVRPAPAPEAAPSPPEPEPAVEPETAVEPAPADQGGEVDVSPEPTSAVAASAAQQAGLPTALPATIEDEEQAAAALEMVVQTLRRVAIFHLRRDERSSIGYQLAHLSAFLGVLPDGDRAAPASSPRRLRALQEAAGAGRWSDVLQQVIDILEEGGDLDLNAERCLAQALEGLGHELALSTLNAHALCASRLLGDLVAAGAETADWLEGMAGPAPAGGAGAQGSGVGGDGALPVEEEGLAAVVAEAERAARRSLEEGCAVIQEALRREGGRAARFRLQLALARLCLEQSAPDLARPILRHLYQELDGPVRSWEPQLLVEVIGGLLECYRQLQREENAPAGAEQEVEQLMVALTEIDPQAALRERARNMSR